MRSIAIIALLLVAALIGFLLLSDESAEESRYDHDQHATGIEDVARDDGKPPVSPASTPFEGRSTEADGQSDDCYDIYTEQMMRLERDVLTEGLEGQIVENARSNWAETAGPELKIFAAQLLEEYGESVALFVREMEHPITSPYFLWSAVNMCLANSKYSECPIDDWLQRLLAVDSENSLVWIRAAGYYHATGDLERAKAALDQASIAYEANDYWFENIMNAKAGIDVIGGFSDRVAYLLAVEVAPNYPSPRTLYENMCKQMSAKDVEWLASCVAFGQHVNLIATRATVRDNAKNLQAFALVASGESEDSERVLALLAPPRTPSPTIRRELYRYPDSTAIYISALESMGEIAALERLVAEHERRNRNGETPECGDINLN